MSLAPGAADPVNVDSVARTNTQEQLAACTPDLPPATEDCSWDNGLACAGDIGSAVFDCAGELLAWIIRQLWKWLSCLQMKFRRFVQCQHSVSRF